VATTEQKRKWYPDHVINHADRGTAGYKPLCDWSGAALIAVPNDSGGVYIEPVHQATAEAWDAYVFLMREFDQSITSAGGVNSCRNIGTSVWPSLHAYLLALDNPPNNRKSAAFQAAVLEVKTNNGKRVFKNLASDDDRMHDEIDVAPTDLATGINWPTVKGWDMLTAAEYDTIKTLTAMLASRKGDAPPWGVSNWDLYQNEVWTGPDTSDPGPLNLVTHIQLAKIYAAVRAKDAQLAAALAALEAASGLTAAEVKALIAATTLDPG
jgi:hypothetical protein